MKEQPISQSLFVSRAHAKFLDTLSDEQFWSYAADMARYFPVVSDRFDEYLICDLGKGHGVLPLAALCEVLPTPARCTLLPSMPIWMQGLLVWRESIIAVIDLVTYFSSDPVDFQRAGAMVLIVRHEDMLLGLQAPVLEAMTDMDMTQLRSVEQCGDHYTSPCKGAIKGVLKDVEGVAYVEDEQELLLLDIPVILADIVQRIRMNVSYVG